MKILDNTSKLPEGQYRIFSHPNTVEQGGDLLLEVDSNGKWIQTLETPEQWGEISIIRTPLTWYFPVAIGLIYSIYLLIEDKISKMLQW